LTNREIVRVLKDLQQVERGIKRCLDFIIGGDGDPGSVRDQLRRLEARKREIEANLKAQKGDMEIAIHWPKSSLSPNKKRPPPPGETAVRS
jgi:hypothetical protein